MKRWLLIVFLLMRIASAQQFVGYVVADSLFGEALHQATVEISSEGKLLKQLKTTFDGTFTFKPTRNTIYNITARMVRYSDTTIQVKTDSKGYTDKPGARFVLKKYGLRLEGYVYDKGDESPVAEVVLVQKNIRTREVKKYVTGKDGYFNIYLDYETNYRIQLDKYSPGMLNIYEDTTFYISTVGFTQPLDYRLNIYLRKIRGYVKPRPDYDPTMVPKNQELVQVVDVKATREDTIRRDSVMKVREAERIAFEKKRVADSISNAEVAQRAYTDSVLVASNKRLTSDSVKAKVARDTSVLVFKIQLAALPKPDARILKLRFTKGKVSTEKGVKGLLRHMLGDFATKSAARKVLAEAVKYGYTKAFVIAYRNGKRLTVEETQKLK